jgi:hypothetical protein
MTEKYWLYVPFETKSNWLRAPTEGALTILGHRAQLLNKSDGPREWWHPFAFKNGIMFDPMPEAEAKSLFEELKARLPVLFVRRHLAVKVLRSESLDRSPPENQGGYDGGVPTLIPEALQPKGVVLLAGDAFVLSDAQQLFGADLCACPRVTDERIAAAIELAISSHYDVLPRSVFLAQMTILDSLAARADRPQAICDWIDAKKKEAKMLGDKRLLTSLGGLKQVSHGTAIQDLVSRAASILGKDKKEMDDLRLLAAKLYRIRSKLSHRRAKPIDAETRGNAEMLVTMVLQAAIVNPKCLEAEKHL